MAEYSYKWITEWDKPSRIKYPITLGLLIWASVTIPIKYYFLIDILPIFVWSSIMFWMIAIPYEFRKEKRNYIGRFEDE